MKSNPEYNQVSNEIWRILIPVDWSRQDCSTNAQVYFESADTSKGLYLLASSSSLSVDIADLEEQRTRDFEILQKMDDSSWSVLKQWTRREGSEIWCGMECLDQTKCYRIVVERKHRGEWDIRAAFHDYACDKIEASRAYFAEMIGSFSFDD